MNRNYSRLLTAYFLSSIGDWFYRLALPIFLFNQTQSPIVMSIAYALTFLPFVLITPFGGVIADNMRRQEMLIYGDFIAFALTLSLALILAFLPHNLMLIYLLVFIVASVTSLSHPAFQGFVPLIVNKDSLAKANSYILIADNLILMLGPICSGAVIAIVGSIDAIYINAFSFLISSLLIATIKVTMKDMPENYRRFTVVSAFVDLKDGFKYSINNPIIKYGCMLFLFVNFGIQIFYSNFMYYLMHNLCLDSKHIGLTLAITGIWAIVGSMIAPKLVEQFSEGRIILVSCVGAGIALLTLFFANNFWMAGLSWGLESMFSSITIVTYFTLRQYYVPNQFLGRTIALTRVVSYLGIPIASIAGGYILQETHDITNLIYIGGFIMIFTGCIGWLTPLNTVKQFINKS